MRGLAPAISLINRASTLGTRDFSRHVVRRVAARIATAFDTASLDFPLLPQDIADSTRLQLYPPLGGKRGQLNIAWLCTPPGPGSGGHTTLFRMVHGLEVRGHVCKILLYNRHESDMDRHRAVIRSNWPEVAAEIASVPARLDGYDACVASSWETAHVLARRGTGSMHRFYFIQDFEPYFYPRGSLYSLSEDSYRFGFQHIALGQMVAAALRENTGVCANVVPFGCDTEAYSLSNYGPRHGVVFYARKNVDRRGFLLAQLALEEFHRRHPGQAIHVYGDPIGSWKIPHSYHGKLSPGELNILYNSSLAGLAMSFTNISLVAEEMLAAGMTPVVNDHRFARLDLKHPGVAWAPATPGGLADALCRVVEETTPQLSLRLTAGVRSGWDGAQAAVARLVEDEVSGATERGPNSGELPSHPVAGSPFPFPQN